jgi:hypothetical protein
MFSEKVKSEIEQITKNIIKKNIFIKKARDGELTNGHVYRHLKNIKYSINFTPIHLQAATKRSRELGLLDVAVFMEDKYKEEFGHEKWVDTDLLNFESSSQSNPNSELTKGIIDLIKYVETLVHGDPTLYVAYITFLEYFTVLAAPELLDYVENRCGISKSTLSVIANHGELDKDHTEDDFKAIEDLVKNHENRDEFINVLHKTGEIINRYFTECAEAA